MQAIGDVIFHRERVEQRRLLKDHADAGAELEQIVLAHRRDLLAEDADRSRVRAKQTIGQLHQDGFAAARRSKNDASFAALDGEGDVLEHRLVVEGDRDVVVDDDRLSRIGDVLVR